MPYRFNLFEPSHLPAAVFGGVALACVLIWPLTGNHRKAIVVQGLGAIAFALHFALLGAATAAAVCLISLSQLLVTASVENRRLIRTLYAISLGALAAVAVLTWHGAISLLAVAGSIAGTLARIQRSTTRMKLFFLLGAPLWVLHNLATGAIFALIVDAISIAGNSSSLLATARRTIASSGLGSLLSTAFAVPAPAPIATDPNGRFRLNYI